MGYHIVTIDSNDAVLSCKDGQLTCRSDGQVRSIPIEDVGAVILTSFSAIIHTKLLIEAAAHGVAFLICESFRPVSLVLPANRATDTHLTRAQATCFAQLRQRLWEKTLDAKCANQHLAAMAIKPDDERLPRLSDWAKKKTANRESECARMYWAIFGDAIVPGQDFRRDRESGGINSMLNYGYAVLLSLVLQNLFAMGLDPTFGIHHATRERSTPLAYDLMEPFRPAVDLNVARWVRSQPLDTNPICKEFRKHVTSIATESYEWEGTPTPLRTIIEGVARSFRAAIKEGQSGLYKPWTQTTTKWDG
jgi:CRISPR-associated protein Cas1